MTMAIVWKNGTLMPPEAASLSVYDHGVLYGDGIFEGIRFFNQKAFHLQNHLQRLFDSANAIGLTLPYGISALEEAIGNTIAHSGMDDGYLRLLVTRGVGALGIDPRSCRDPQVVIIADECQLVCEEKRQQGLRVVISSVRRLSAAGLDPRIKSLNYLNHILARLEANDANADEAILLNDAGYLTEGCADNLFIVKDGVLKTPPCSDGALAGVTRGLILSLAESVMAVSVTSLTPYDLYTADEVFLTGTGAELLPVAEVAGRKVGEGSRDYYQQLLEAYQRAIVAEVA